MKKSFNETKIHLFKNKYLQAKNMKKLVKS